MGEGATVARDFVRVQDGARDSFVSNAGTAGAARSPSGSMSASGPRRPDDSTDIRTYSPS